MKCTDSTTWNLRNPRPLNPALAAAVQRYRERRGIPTGPVPPLPEPNGLPLLLALSRPAEREGGR
jgi:hypothetical protein